MQAGSLKVYSKIFWPSQLPGRDGRCVQGSVTYSPRHPDPRLLVIPASWGRVAAPNPN